MKPLVPIVDQMHDLAREELPSPRTCRIRLWDDATFDVVIYHGMGDDEKQCLRYERTTGEILWEHVVTDGWETTEFAVGEAVHEPAYAERQVRVIATVDPPYR